VIQPLSIFPDIDKEEVLPNSLYTLYQEKYGISIVEVRDELSAVNINARTARELGLQKGDAAMMAERSSVNIDGRVVEWSRAYCNSDFVYAVTLK